MQRQVITPGIWWQAHRLEASAMTPGMRIVRWASLVAVLLSAITVAFDWSAIVAVLAAPGALLDRLLALALQQKLQIVLLMLSAALLIANFGFGRMIHRAGKPEFYCLAVLPFTSAEVNGMDVLARERPFTDKTEIVGISPVDPAAPIGPQLMSLCRFFTSPEAGGRQGQRASFPLYHGLAMLQEIVAEGGIHGDSMASFLQARLAPR